MTTSEHAALNERVLLLMPPDRGLSRTETVLAQANLYSHACADMDELCRELEQGAGTAVLALELLTPIALKCLVEILVQQESWSDFPLLILFDRIEQTAATGLRMLDLLEPLGNVTILQEPVSAVGLASAVRAALRARRRQYQVRDLTQQWHRAIRHRERFLNLMAHELRNPLSTIRQAMQILDQLGAQTNQAIEQRAVVVRQTSRLAQLIDEVQDVHQVMAGKVRLRREPNDLAALASRCLTLVAAEAEAQRQELVLDKPTEPVLVEGDPQRLEQVLLQLLTNALRYTPPRGRIEVGVAREDDTAVLWVRDTGVGLSVEQLAGLFEQFSEGDDSLERPSQGGLRIGLTLVQGLVKLHNGSVSASSPGPGRGCKFVVRLPLQAAPTPSVAVHGDVPFGRLRRVLVIEDNDDGRESMQLLLQLWGHQVETACDGPQGVQKALARRPDVVLTDIGLPGMDGYKVARELRAALGQSVYLIAMTGYGQSHDRQQAAEAGFNAFLVKPVVPTMLQEILAGPPQLAGRA